MEILRLLRPLRYKVTLVEGAVVRRSVELASNEVKRLMYGEIVEVRAFGHWWLWVLDTGTSGMTMRKYSRLTYMKDDCIQSLRAHVL